MNSRPEIALALCLAVFTACSGASRPAASEAEGSSERALAVATDRGVVVGQRRDGARAFFAIPYAAPPIGALRWRPPAPAAAWAGRRDATQRGPACPQPEEGALRETSEDCLQLNVWVPEEAAAQHAKLPVLVWIHGGGFYQGSGADDLYDAAKLARRAGLLVVTLNYRLGALGFSSHPALVEAGRAALPSMGLLDQRAALQWVQRNIAAFGGDPDNVTLDGESAGAWSIYSHLAMPGSRGLFARAIVQSGATDDALYFTPAQANAQGVELARRVGCLDGDAAAVARCLRGKPAAELVSALPYRRGLLLQPGVWWGPTVDGAELPRRPLAAIAAGDFAKVPLLLGTARDEGTIHTFSFDEVTPDELAWFLASTFGERVAAAALPFYTAGAYAQDGKAALTDVVTYGIFRCNARRTARAAAAHGVPVYLYEWAHALEGPPAARAFGATHGIDLFFVFGNVSMGLGAGAAEQPLVQLVQDLWGSFARGGAPRAPGGAGLAWPRYTAAGDEHVTLAIPAQTGARLDAALCDRWDSFAR